LFVLILHILLPRIRFSLNATLTFSKTLCLIDAMTNATAQLIASLGGPAEVARRLGYPASGGTQRVSNWIARNRIPLQVRVDHPDLFPMHAASVDTGCGTAASPPV
jgi:hypothetical protein